MYNITLLIDYYTIHYHNFGKETRVKQIQYKIKTCLANKPTLQATKQDQIHRNNHIIKSMISSDFISMVR